jgi:hypothetical protein
LGEKLKQPGVLRSLACGASFVIALFTFGHSEAATNFDLPPGSRLPEKTEVQQDWRSSSPTRYLTVTGDFVGIGHPETAHILVRTDGSGFAPFIAVRRGGATRVYQGEKTNEMGYLQKEGIKIAKPGTYVTACGKGYFDCDAGEKESVTISTDGVEFFEDEGASRLIYWDPQKKHFAEVWLSD